MYRGDIYDMFVSDATAEELVAADLDDLADQARELRAYEPDNLAMTDAEIAEAIQAHAQSLIDGTPDVWLAT